MTIERTEGRRTSEEQSVGSQALYEDAYREQQASRQHGSNAMQEIGAMFGSAFSSQMHQTQADWTAAGETFDAMGRFIGRQIDSAGDAVTAYGASLARENQEMVRASHQAVSAASDAIDHSAREVARGYSDINERFVDHARTRPTTVSTEIWLPGVAFIDSQLRGRTEEQVAAEARAARPRQAAEAPQQQQRVTQFTVQAGDSYWSIAERHLERGGQRNASNAEIQALSARLSEQNSGRQLHPGMSITNRA